LRRRAEKDSDRLTSGIKFKTGRIGRRVGRTGWNEEENKRSRHSRQFRQRVRSGLTANRVSNSFMEICDKQSRETLVCDKRRISK
jgi:hypothetical protein